MAIPWVTVFYVFRKILPVVIDNAPDLIKTFDRRRTTAPQAEPTTSESSLTQLQERIETQAQHLAAQMEILTQLQATLRATRRSLIIAWMVLATTVLLGVVISAVLLFRS